MEQFTWLVKESKLYAIFKRPCSTLLTPVSRAVAHLARSISPRVQAPLIFLVHNLYCDKCIKQPYLQVSRLSIEFLGLVLTFNEREYEVCRGFAIVIFFYHNI